MGKSTQRKEARRTAGSLKPHGSEPFDMTNGCLQCNRFFPTFRDLQKHWDSQGGRCRMTRNEQKIIVRDANTRNEAL